MDNKYYQAMCEAEQACKRRILSRNRLDVLMWLQRALAATSGTDDEMTLDTLITIGVGVISRWIEEEDRANY